MNSGGNKCCFVNESHGCVNHNDSTVSLKLESGARGWGTRCRQGEEERGNVCLSLLLLQSESLSHWGNSHISLRKGLLSLIHSPEGNHNHNCNIFHVFTYFWVPSMSQMQFTVYGDSAEKKANKPTDTGVHSMQTRGKLLLERGHYTRYLWARDHSKVKQLGVGKPGEPVSQGKASSRGKGPVSACRWGTQRQKAVQSALEGTEGIGNSYFTAGIGNKGEIYHVLPDLHKTHKFSLLGG